MAPYRLHLGDKTQTVRQVRPRADWPAGSKPGADWPASRLRRHAGLISFTVGALAFSLSYLGRSDGRSFTRSLARPFSRVKRSNPNELSEGSGDRSLAIVVSCENPATPALKRVICAYARARTRGDTISRARSRASVSSLRLCACARERAGACLRAYTS